MPESIAIQPSPKPIRASIRPPGSKSITNRALVCAALAGGRSVLVGALDSEDTRVMIAGLRSLGIDIEVSDEGKTLSIDGCGGRPPAASAEIFVENSGTTIRFLTALVALGHGEFTLDGIPRMRERPIGDLVNALRQLEVDIACLGESYCPPVLVKAQGLRGGTVQIHGGISSQYLSGLMMAAPCAANEINIRVDGTLVSVPYVAMTAAVMRSFGVSIDAPADYSRLSVPRQHYVATDYDIEPDASAASYFWAAAAVTGGEVTVEGLSRQSLQGDVGFVECLRQMGCDVTYSENSITVVGKPLRAIDIDMNAISDTVQTLAPVALFADGTTRIRNVGHIRHKETDRIAAVAIEMRKLGASVVESQDGLEITPGEWPSGDTAIDTYNDHRMAMSFAVAGLARPGVVINEPGCTVKTYPHFFDDLRRLVE
ncbi:MAG: 3-phosphoshikimate 1-carboxyvinyltransferase [Planctomycetota bacterium]